jgi:DivIVA domain-containing protein
MPLTPDDVHNVAFSKPPVGKRGYNEDEVDAFLDLVESTLTRLYSKVDRLKVRLHATTPPSPLPPPVTPQPEPVTSGSGWGTDTSFDDLFDGGDT